MWPLPQIRSEHIQLILHHDRAVCVRFTQDGAYMHMQNYRTYHIPIGSAKALYNMTALHEVITDFAISYNLNAAYLSIVIGQELLQEYLICHTESDVSLGLLVSDRADHTRYQVHHIGPHEEKFLFYVYAISQPLALQLEIMHQRLPLHMHRVITPLSAQIEVYKHLVAPTFSQARLVQEIDIEQVSIPTVFSPEVLRRSIKFDAGTVYNIRDTVYALGSYLGAQK